MITFKQLGRYGRFANGMFQISSTIGIARKSGQKYVFPLWRNWDHEQRFGSSEDCDLYKHFVNRLPEMPEQLQFIEKFVHWGFHHTVLPVGNISLSGHMQSDKYFDHCMDEVRYWMQMNNEPGDSDKIAIHVRRGDYDNNYHPRLGIEYYGRAIKQFPKGSPFMVFSDGIDECKEMFKGIDNVEYSIGNDYITDFKIMKSCRHFIIGNSSYSLMAAILANQFGKKVVCPSKWFGPVAGLSSNDLYPKASIVI